MKRLHLYYFSGTGTTTMVATSLARGMEARGYAVDLLPIEEFVRGERELPKERPDLAGFGAPVIGFGTPRIVRRFLRGLPAAPGVPAFVFRCAGGASPINARASMPMLRTLERKGYEPFYERCFAIASNWIHPHEPAVVHRLRLATERKVEATCEGLVAGTRRLNKVSALGGLALDALRAMSAPGIRLIGRGLSASKDCNGCGLCARRCPAANISLRRGRARFGGECTTCLRCVYACPRKAISVRHFGSVAIAEGFDLGRSLDEARARAGDTPGKIPPFLEGYEADLDA